ncbi:hypothetical protein M529_20290 [Sphingobium ummariense RL-3]|uniref:Uncharacterized protein n=1 Tax=Sphingobium ummariense RL-3 TaxID=1346791 RepID=T0IX35_9SPHN|nr:hypothetical protein M529_20290 [Sphingobium ummariense RL-3]
MVFSRQGADSFRYLFIEIGRLRFILHPISRSDEMSL